MIEENRNIAKTWLPAVKDRTLESVDHKFLERHTYLGCYRNVTEKHKTEVEYEFISDD
jgi:hypothetical protein